MHGIGNDYVYVNCFEQTIDDPSLCAIAVSDRHRGIGADGLILILPPEKNTNADVRMRIFNADGSEAEMCGNGIRCLAKYAHDHGITCANPMSVQTGNGVLSIRYTIDDTEKLASATVDMERPILEANAIPVTVNGVDGSANVVDYPFDDIAGMMSLRMTCVSMGNPHAVFFCDDVTKIDLQKIGPKIEEHAWFPNRVNVHFVSVQSRKEITMRTWERGSGITLACGTGACAVAVAGVLCGHTDRSIVAHLPGGDLTLDWREDNDHVYMTGPATEVFSGDWPD